MRVLKEDEVSVRGLLWGIRMVKNIRECYKGEINTTKFYIHCGFRQPDHLGGTWDGRSRKERPDDQSRTQILNISKIKSI